MESPLCQVLSPKVLSKIFSFNSRAASPDGKSHASLSSIFVRCTTVLFYHLDYTVDQPLICRQVKCNGVVDANVKEENASVSFHTKSGQQLFYFSKYNALVKVVAVIPLPFRLQKRILN